MKKKTQYKEKRIMVFYNPKMIPENLGEGTETPSPMKPQLLMEYFNKEGLNDHFELISDFKPFGSKEFYLGHTKEYVDGFFNGEEPYASSNGLLGIDWSEHFANSVKFTNASLYNAIRSSIDDPKTIYLSPTSGFHHAKPERGDMFCAFSGQVIAAVKIYNETGHKGAFIDLDGHFGNSIDDSRDVIENLDTIIPKGANINILKSHDKYITELKTKLLTLEELIIEGKVNYVVFCHGADSHEYDDLGSQLTTSEWMECSTIFCDWLMQLQEKTQINIPVSLSLFGGYRDDDFNSVLSLHTASILNVLKLLGNVNIDYQPKVKKRY